MTKEILENIASVLSFYFLHKNLNDNILNPYWVALNEVKAVLKILNIREEYNNLFYKNELRVVIPSVEQGKWGPKHRFKRKITPYSKISRFDIGCIEEILNDNSYSLYSHLLRPLFESIGWDLNKREDYFFLTFVGSKNYISALTPDYSWKK